MFYYNAIKYHDCRSCVEFFYIISNVTYDKFLKKNCLKFDQELEQYCMRHCYDDNSTLSTIHSFLFVEKINQIR